MTPTKIVGALLAALVVASGAAAAMPGNAPADSQAGQAGNYVDDSADERADAMDEADETDGDKMDEANETAGDERAAAAGPSDDRRGPPSDMPAGVPDFVSQIHDLIGQKIDGTLSDLGDAISQVTPGGSGDDEAGADSAGGQTDGTGGVPTATPAA